jgi:hypothetical protein
MTVGGGTRTEGHHAGASGDQQARVNLPLAQQSGGCIEGISLAQTAEIQPAPA